jgi:WD40 repeat protein
VWDLETGRAALTRRGHTHYVRCVAIHPGDQLVASGGDDATVRLWGLTPSRGPLVLKGGPDDGFAGLAFSPDGKLLAGAAYATRIADVDHAKGVWVWEAATGKRVSLLKGHTSWLNEVTFCPDGKRLASASQDGTARVWDAATGRELLTFRGHKEYVACLAFSPDGKRIASAVRDDVKVWDAATGEVLLELDGGNIEALAFAADGRRLVIGGWRGVKVWDTSTGRETRPLAEPGEWVRAVAFSPDGKWLAAGGGRPKARHRPFPPSSEVHLWNAATGQRVHSCQGHTEAVTGVAFSRDGRRLVTASYDGTIRLWDTATGLETFRFEHDPRSGGGRVTFSPDGKRLAWTGGGGVTVWDTTPGVNLPRP